MTGTLLITGGSGLIGRAIARAAARSGYQVALTYLTNQAIAASVCEEIVAEGGRAVAYRADTRDLPGVRRLVADVEAGLGAITALVVCAGAVPERRAFLDTDPADVDRQIDVNLTGALACIRAVVERYGDCAGGERSPPAIVTVSSESGRFGGNGLTAYAASKGGLNMATVALAREFRALGIRVNAVSPGVVAEVETPGSPSLDRPGRPDEVAAAVLWLLSAGASYVSGAVLPVAGGR